MDVQLQNLFDIYGHLFEPEKWSSIGIDDFPIVETDPSGNFWSHTDGNPSESYHDGGDEVARTPRPWSPYEGTKVSGVLGSPWPWPPAGSALPLPPPDVLGFYLPFHRYYQPGSDRQFWGIYLIASGIREFGEWLHAHTAGRAALRLGQRRRLNFHAAVLAINKSVPWSQ